MVFAKEETAIEYEKSYQTTYHRAQTLEKTLLKKLLSQFSDAENVLEVGCGTAHFTRWFSTLGLKCIGIDTSNGMLKQAKKHWSQGTLLKSDGSHLPFQDNSFDLVAFITSLEFIRDAELALVEAARVTRKGLILGLLNKHIGATLKRKLSKKQDAVFSQATYYTLQDIENMLNKTGKKYYVASWRTTVFPRFIGNFESKVFPYGDFLGAAIKF
ncbi:MAG: class I SAM-dependent methyltransferase [Candidatus Bathyarchaeia archaeon]|jgi:ubiquinone/menaquinone biosynthesis C-methylase UbiE